MRNIILISADSLRADHCSLYGYNRDTTPFLDNPPCSQITFDKAISPSTWTLPSMKGMFTGEIFDDWPENMIDKRKVAAKEFVSQNSIAKLLSDNNYATFGLSPNPHTSVDSGFDKGFDMFNDFSSEGRIIKIFNQLIGGRYGTFLEFLFEKKGFSTGRRQIPEFKNNVLPADEPLFCWMFLLDTHIPYQSKWTDRKWSTKIDQLYHNIRFWMRLNNVDRYGWASFDEEEKQKMINLYDDSILSMDEYIREIWRAAQPLDPVMIVLGDHGEAFGENGYYAHARELDQELIHVPLTILNYGESRRVSERFSLLNLPQLVQNIAGGKEILNGISTELATSKVWEDNKSEFVISFDNNEYYFSEDGHPYRQLPNSTKDRIAIDDLPDVVNKRAQEIRTREEISRIRYAIKSISQEDWHK